jgi:general secretion pathway protein G
MDTRQHVRTKRGFTLIELLVVILILAVLAALIVPRLINRGEDAKVVAAKSNLASYGRMIQAFRIDTGRFPSTEEGLQALREQPADLENWKGPYLDKPIEPDPWGNDYQYELIDEDNYLLFSFGSDGAEGGEGRGEDIVESGA